MAAAVGTALRYVIQLLLSTGLSAIASGVISIAVFGTAWLAGVVGTLGATFNISELKTVGQAARYILPTDGRWRGAIYYASRNHLWRAVVETTDRGHPFSAQAPPSCGYLVWVSVWFLVVLGAGLLSFQRREL